MSRARVATVALLLAAVLGVLVVAVLRPVATPAARGSAPAVTLPRLIGAGTYDLGTLRGRPALVNFWASWCADCRAEFAALRAARDQFRDQGLVVVGVAVQDTADGARAFADESGADWPLLFDEGSRAALAYGVTAVPQTFFVAADGRIDAVHAGPIGPDALTDGLDRLVGGAP
jgi:cytochrome c biogenesis protein CcmG, thiol:disulfide interchange protein DsbE